MLATKVNEPAFKATYNLGAHRIIGRVIALDLLRVLTREDTGEMIGTIRETVSRLFADFKKKHFIQSKGTSRAILNKLRC